MSHLHVSSIETVFHTQPRSPLFFQPNLSAIHFCECTTQDRSVLPHQSQNQTPVLT